MNEAFGDRMKRYENVFRFYLPPRQPVIIRVDGKAFHSFTKQCNKPFDPMLADSIDAAAVRLVQQTQNARCAYVQSDEVSILLVDYNALNTEQCFGGNLQKIVSIAAATASVEFTQTWQRLTNDNQSAVFDGRAFILPESEVCNYFYWRQLDCIRNAVQMVGRAYFSHRELHKKGCEEIKKMLLSDKRVDFDLYPLYWQRGRIITHDGTIDREVPVFSEDRGYIEKFLVTEE